MIYDILFAVCGIGLITLGLRLAKLDTLVDSWKMETVRLMGLLNDLDNKRFEDSCRLAKAFQCIQALEERVAALEKRVEVLEEGSGEYFKSQL